MRLVIAGLESSLELAPGGCSTLQVENESLFARIALSLASGEGRYAAEPYSFWADDAEVRPKESLLFVKSPLDLPWDDRLLSGEVVKRMEREFLADEDMRQVVEAARKSLSDQFVSLGFGFDSDYALGLEWDFKKLLKFMGFEVTYQQEKSFLDNLLNFLSFASDSGDKRVIGFVNLKNFLTKSEFQVFLQHVFYLKKSVLLLENKRTFDRFEHERKLIVDRDLIEFNA
jgi:CRISPR-associated protein Csn2